MEEKVIDLTNNEHWNKLESLFLMTEPKYVHDILDFASGKTSLSCLITFYKEAKIDALIFPDPVKREILEENVKSFRYTIIEKDIMRKDLNKKYDLVLVHSSLVESMKYGYDPIDIFNKILKIKSRYFIALDYSDPAINFDMMRKEILYQGFEILYEKEYKREDKFKLNSFDVDTLKVILFKRK